MKNLAGWQARAKQIQERRLEDSRVEREQRETWAQAKSCRDTRTLVARLFPDISLVDAIERDGWLVIDRMPLRTGIEPNTLQTQPACGLHGSLDYTAVYQSTWVKEQTCEQALAHLVGCWSSHSCPECEKDT